MKPYSMDLRQRVLAACDGGVATAEVAEAFSVSESWVRRVKRTVDGLWSAIGRLLDRFTPGECRNYFRHCGYDATPT